MFEFNENKQGNDDDEHLSGRNTKHIHSFEVNFEDVVAEPAGISSFKCSWFINRLVFKLTKSILYFILSMIVAPVVMFCWGILYAWALFMIIWVSTPLVHLVRMLVEPIGKMVRIILNVTIVPFFEACGAQWSRIKFHHYYVPQTTAQNDHFTV